MANKVTIKGATQAVQMFGPAQAAVARAVVDSVREGIIPQDQVDDLCIIVGVFIHWEATDDKKIFDCNYQATKESIARAMGGEPSAAAGRRRRGRGAPPVRRREPRGRPSAGPHVAAGRVPARRRPRRRHGREQRHRRRDRGGVRRRRRHGARHVPPQRGGRARGRRRHRARGGRALVARADLGTRAACEALVAEARERLGGLDVWVNNAGADVLTGDAADWDWERKLDLLLAVDLKGTIACSYAAGAACASRPAAARS